MGILLGVGAINVSFFRTKAITRKPWHLLHVDCQVASNKGTKVSTDARMKSQLKSVHIQNIRNVTHSISYIAFYAPLPEQRNHC